MQKTKLLPLHDSWDLVLSIEHLDDLLTRSSSESYFSFSKSPMLQVLSKYAFVGA